MKRLVENGITVILFVMAGIAIAGFSTRLIGRKSLFGNPEVHESFLSNSGNTRESVLTANADELKTSEVVPVSRYVLSLSNCIGVANTTKSNVMLIKRGEQFAVQNDDSVARTVIVFGKKYSVEPLSSTLVVARGWGEYTVLCGNKKAAIINVQP